MRDLIQSNFSLRERVLVNFSLENMGEKNDPSIIESSTGLLEIPDLFLIFPRPQVKSRSSGETDYEK